MRLLAVAMLLSPLCAWSQMVNVIPLFDEDIESGWSAILDGSVDLRTGNVELLLLSGTGVVRYRNNSHVSFVAVHGEKGTQGGAQFVSRHLEHARHRTYVREKVALEIFGQHERDLFRLLDLRVSAGAGPRLEVGDPHSAGAAFGLAYTLELERADSERAASHRLAAYAVGAARLNGFVATSVTFLTQPRLDSPADVRNVVEGDLRVTLTEFLTVRTGVSLAHDARPPAGVRGVDVATRTALSFRL